MTALFGILLTLLVLPAGPLAGQKDSLRDYAPFSGIGTTIAGNRPLIVLRRFMRDSLPCYLTVNPEDLSTMIRKQADLNLREESWDMIRKTFAASNYFRTMAGAEGNAKVMQDAGITRLSESLPGIALTVDLCPSQNPLDRVLFTELIGAFEAKEKPVPVSLSISGLWLKHHEEDFKWLLQLAERKEISVTWINHTYHHRTGKDLPMNENFLLEKGTDLKGEILRLEEMMIRQGITPSVFFRFPGLVSDEKTFKAVTAFGLIPVGSDAWIGKNQYPREGSIVLLHGNGNEPIGIKRFLKMIREGDESITGKSWMLLDLREGLARPE